MNRINKLFYLLSGHEKRRLALLVCALLISSFIGVAGIASIMPFVGVLSNPDIVRENAILSWFYTTLHFTDIKTYTLYLGIALLGVFIFSNIFLTLTIWMELHFIRMVGYNMSRNLLIKYLNQPYSFYLLRNPADLSKNLFSEVQQVIAYLVKPLMEIITKGILALAILVFLVVVNPRMALVMGTLLGGAYGLIFMFIRRKLSRVGRRRVDANAKRFLVANEAFGGIKDVKLMGKEEVYIGRFSKPAKTYENSLAVSQILSRLPKYAMEAIAFGGMLAVALYMFAQNSNIAEVLPLIALYAFAGYRLMPSLQDMFAGITHIRSNLASLDLIYNDLRDYKNIVMKSCIDEPVLPLSRNIEVRKISFKYDSAPEMLFKNLSLSIEANTTVGFVGPTGCGKTTIVDILLGLLVPQKGQVLLDGNVVDDSNRSRWQKNCGFVPQQIYIADDTVTRNIAFGMPDDKIDMEAVVKAAKIANIHEFVMKEMKDNYNTVVGDRGIRLSGGQRQRIGIARALYTNPSVLILDEATSALDGKTEMAIMEAVRSLARKKTIIMIAHRLTTLKYCDLIYVMDKGKIVEKGGYGELNRKSKYFSPTRRIEKPAAERAQDLE